MTVGKKNLGDTKLRKHRRTSDPMKEFDRMPKLLREWLSGAALPWAPKSVYRAYKKALKKNGNSKIALQYLDNLQQKRLSADQKISR